MTYWTRGLTVSVMLTTLVACAATMPTQDQLAAADYGAPITQSAAEQQALGLLRTILKDPYSAQIEWSSVQTGWIREAPIHGGALRFGYILSASVNAKNSYGGYTGFKPYQFLFFNGDLVSAYSQQELRGSYGSAPYMGKIK